MFVIAVLLCFCLFGCNGKVKPTESQLQDTNEVTETNNDVATENQKDSNVVLIDDSNFYLEITDVTSDDMFMHINLFAKSKIGAGIEFGLPGMYLELDGIKIDDVWDRYTVAKEDGSRTFDMQIPIQTIRILGFEEYSMLKTVNFRYYYDETTTGERKYFDIPNGEFHLGGNSIDIKALKKADTESEYCEIYLGSVLNGTMEDSYCVPVLIKNNSAEKTIKIVSKGSKYDKYETDYSFGEYELPPQTMYVTEWNFYNYEMEIEFDADMSMKEYVKNATLMFDIIDISTDEVLETENIVIPMGL